MVSNSSYWTKFHFRTAYSRLLSGQGIEIGALHQPLAIDGTNIKRVQYVDRMTVAELRSHYPELSNFKFAPVDVLDNGETLTKVKDNSLDFIIANHFIEHTRNPIGTIRTWANKLKSGGIIYMGVPDKRCTFDRDRPLTTLEHLIEDDRLPVEERLKRDLVHYREYATLVDKKVGPECEQHVIKLVSSDYSIHFHTFIGSSFLELLKYIYEDLQVPISLAGYVDALNESDEFLIVLSKK
jgi:SAM-dependent methyltransferase